MPCRHWNTPLFRCQWRTTLNLSAYTSKCPTHFQLNCTYDRGPYSDPTISDFKHLFPVYVFILQIGSPSLERLKLELGHLNPASKPSLRDLCVLIQQSCEVDVLHTASGLGTPLGRTVGAEKCHAGNVEVMQFNWPLRWTCTFCDLLWVIFFFLNCCCFHIASVSFTRILYPDLISGSTWSLICKYHIYIFICKFKISLSLSYNETCRLYIKNGSGLVLSLSAKQKTQISVVVLWKTGVWFFFFFMMEEPNTAATTIRSESRPDLKPKV